MIRNSQQLKSCDLRWNELGNAGVKLLIGAVVGNGEIVSVEIQGNGAVEETVLELQSALADNRKNLVMPQSRLGPPVKYVLPDK